MRKYEAPKIKVIELNTTDIIQTSGTLDKENSTTIPSTGVIVPIPGVNPKYLEI